MSVGSNEGTLAVERLLTRERMKLEIGEALRGDRDFGELESRSGGESKKFCPVGAENLMCAKQINDCRRCCRGRQQS